MPPVLIYTKAWCPHCSSAQPLLERKGVAYQEIDIGGRPAERSAMIARSGGGTTVPQIFVGDAHVGGCDDLYALDRAGRLDPLLAAA